MNPKIHPNPEHEGAGRAVYRNWCAACVGGRGVGLLFHDTRRRRHASNSGLSRQQVWSKLRDLLRTEMPHRILHFISCSVFIKDLGSFRIILKCDMEPSTKALQDAAIEACAGVEVVGDHMANGGVKLAVREVKQQCRTLRISPEHDTGVRIADDSPLLSWLLNSVLMHNMRIGKDGKRVN